MLKARGFLGGFIFMLHILKLCPSSLRIPVNPLRVAPLTRERKLEDLINRRVRLILLFIHNNRHLTLRSPSSIKSRPMCLELRHCGVGIDSRL